MTKTWNIKPTPALFSPPLISFSLLLTSSFSSLTFLPHSRQNSSIYKYQQPTLLNCIHTHHKHTHQSKPMNTVAYCCQQSQHTLPRPLLPMETGVCVCAHVMLTSYPHTAAALNNKLFQGQIADKNPFFHPTKKDQERGWEKRAGWREKLKSNQQWRTSLLSWIYLRILSSFLIYSPNCLQLLPFQNS